MPRYLAFLRAINVGGHTVKMDHLRRLFEGLGFSNVETFIASGNVVFDSKSTNAKTLTSKIESHLKQELGYEVTTYLRSTSEVAKVAAYEPFKKTELARDGNQLHVGFLTAEPTAEAKRALLALSNEFNSFHINQREIYWLRRPREGVSEFPSGALEKALRMKATFRNVTTVGKLAAKYP